MSRQGAFFADCLIVINPNLPGLTNKTRQSGCFTLALSEGQARKSSISKLAKMDLSEAAGFNHRAVFEFLAENWDQIPTPPYGEKPEFVPMKCHILDSKHLDELRRRLGDLGVSGLSMLSEGFNVRDLCRPQIDDWLSNDKWIDI